MTNQEMVDIAISTAGEMYGVSWDPTATGGNNLYHVVVPTTPGMGVARANRVAPLGFFYNGLTFAPPGMVNASEVLLGVDNVTDYSTSYVDIINTQTGQTTFVGGFGGNLKSSGDILAVAGVGLYAAAKDTNGVNKLVSLSPTTGTATVRGTTIGYTDVWGLAYWNGNLLGFNSEGVIMTINATTGVGTFVRQYSAELFGATVSPTVPLTVP